MDAVLIALVLCGLLVGATGTWSPCGFSMIETIGPTGHTGGLPTTLAASATFAPFAVAGGAITFGGLALLGSALHDGGAFALAVGSAVALVAAVAEARGLPIMPQVRRQLPVGWRGAVPMPLAAAGYGALLGLGFTTFVLSYGVWALMGVALAVGDPALGLALGAAFGVGRAVPIVVLAPLADRPAGMRACEAMALRPGLLRGARLGDAAALVLVAGMLAADAQAAAARPEVSKASDPSTAGNFLAYETAEGAGVLTGPAGELQLEGTEPAIGGPWLAQALDGAVEVSDRTGGELHLRVRAEGVDAVAVSRSWLAYRTRADGRDALYATPIPNKARSKPKPERVARAKSPAQLGAPSLDLARLAFTSSSDRRSKLVSVQLAKGKRTVLLDSPERLFTAPSLDRGRIAYVETTPSAQRIRVKRLNGGRGRAVHSRGPGPPTLWSTSLHRDRVYFTLVPGTGSPKILSAPR